MPTLRVEFSNFDHIILIVDGKQVNVNKEYFEISMDYEIHDIEVQNLANINSTSFCATGYRPRIKLLNPVTKERVVNHILAFSTNYKMCVWKGKLKIHRSAILQFKANTYEFDNFLYVKSKRKKVELVSSQNVILYDENISSGFNQKQKRIIGFCNFMGLFFMCSIILGYGIYAFYQDIYVYYDKFLNFAWRGKDALFIHGLLILYGCSKLIFYTIRLNKEMKQI